MPEQLSEAKWYLRSVMVSLGMSPLPLGASTLTILKHGTRPILPEFPGLRRPKRDADALSFASGLHRIAGETGWRRESLTPGYSMTHLHCHHFGSALCRC